MQAVIEELKPIDEAADYLRVCKKTLRTWAIAGKLPHFRLGSRWMFAKSDLDEFVANSRRIAV